jgi:E3 ubiquitin-protein ligase BRE1
VIQERISVLQAELQRCKARMAADSGDEDLAKFFWSDHPEDASYVDDLKSKLA